MVITRIGSGANTFEAKEFLSVESNLQRDTVESAYFAKSDEEELKIIINHRQQLINEKAVQRRTV